MKKILLFSNPTENNREKLYKELFPAELNNKVFAYMPSNGDTNPQKFTNIWKEVSEIHSAEFVYINNHSENIETEIQKLRDANILLITGGNTFELLKQLKDTKLDKEIINFAQKDNFVLAGFSAGALILTPNIKVCNLNKYDPNLVDLQDLTSLGIVDFEIFPHYCLSDKETFINYSNNSEFDVIPIPEDEIIINNL
jgi:peptidase E